MATDCEGWGYNTTTNEDGNTIMHVVCCNKDGTTLEDGYGVCTEPCVNTGLGHCPTSATVACEKQIGESCGNAMDCSGWGWGAGGVGTIFIRTLIPTIFVFCTFSITT
jgi:hypothetical protein